MRRLIILKVMRTILKLGSLRRETKKSRRVSVSFRTWIGLSLIPFEITIWISSIVAVLSYQLFEVSVIFNFYSVDRILLISPIFAFNSTLGLMTITWVSWESNLVWSVFGIDWVSIPLLYSSTLIFLSLSFYCVDLASRSTTLILPRFSPTVTPRPLTWLSLSN